MCCATTSTKNLFWIFQYFNGRNVRLPIMHVDQFYCWYSLPACLSVCPSVCLSASMSVCLSASVGLSVCLYICLSVCLRLCLSVCLYICVSVYLPVCLYVCLFVCLSASISFSSLLFFATQRSDKYLWKDSLWCVG